MLGFIKKDLLMICQNLKIFGIMFLVFFVLTILNESDMTFILPFMSVMLSISTFNYDHYHHWDAYAVALPNGRTDSVKAKYISTFLFVFFSFLLSLISLFLIKICGLSLDSSSFTDLIGCLWAAFLIISFMFPVIYKFGVEKGRIVLFLFFFGVTGIAVLISENVSIPIPQNFLLFFKNYGQFLLPILIGFFLFVSYKISKRVYLKKEF